jgi:hypothetical protein
LLHDFLVIRRVEEAASGLIIVHGTMLTPVAPWHTGTSTPCRASRLGELGERGPALLPTERRLSSTNVLPRKWFGELPPAMAAGW